MRDKVKHAMENKNSLDSDDDDSSGGEFEHNTDLTYFDVMNPDEKIMTLNNRASKLHERTMLMMQEI